MTRSIRLDFHSSLAGLVLDDIQLQKSAYHYFLGKVDRWDTLDAKPVVPTPFEYDEDIAIRDDAIYFKKIGKNDVTLAAKRYDWTINTIIPQWDNTKDMTDVGFYVLTSDDNVYVCLDNAEDELSIIEPTGKSFYPFRTADGYLWKYLYTVPGFKKRKFTSIAYIPVQRALSDSFYGRGAIEDVVVVEQGSGYVNAQLTTIEVLGAGSGSGATLSITSVGTIGDVSSIGVIAGGTGYTAGCKIVVNSSVGSGVVLEPIITSGVITAINIVAAGVGYSTSDTVHVSVGGAILVPMLSSAGSIVGVKIIDSGAGYSTAPILNVLAAGGSPSGLYGANSGAILEPVLDAGKIVRVLVRDPGKDYPVDTDTQIFAQGDGENALFTPVVYNGQIVDVIIENAGEGYNSVILHVVGTGFGASIRAIIGNSDFESEQAIVEQTAVNGGLHSIKVTSPGSGYTSAATVSISGDGTGCTAEVELIADGVKRIKVLTPGSGYTRATATIVDPNRIDISNTLPVAIVYPVLAPLGGHGKDAVSHLGASILAISSSLRDESRLTDIPQEYRQFGLFKDLRTTQTGKFFKLDSDIAAYKVVLATVVGIIIDEILTNGTSSYKVVAVDGDEVILQPISAKAQVPSGNLYAKDNPARAYFCSRIISSPTVDKYSGKLLYVSNENPFAFTENQGLLIKTFLKF